MTTIYSDDRRTVTVDGPTLTIAQSPTAGGRHLDLSIAAVRILDTVPRTAAAAIRATGQDPDGWYSLQCLGHVVAVLPPASRASVSAIFAAALQARAAEDAEADRIAAMPVHCDRRKISSLFAHAARLRDYPGDYWPALHRAEDALAAWRRQYPDAARREDIARLRDRADEQRHLGAGALVYDADGSLTDDMQQARHDQYIQQAADLDRQAVALEKKEE